LKLLTRLRGELNLYRKIRRNFIRFVAMFIKHLTIVTLALYWGLAVHAPGQAQTQSNSSSLSDKLENGFSPPPTDPLPENRQGGATRGSKVGCQELAPDEFAPHNCPPEELTPEELAPDEFAPKPLTSSPTDLTNW
jgi:hypothetical protein